MTQSRLRQLLCIMLLGLTPVRAPAVDSPVWLRDVDTGKAKAKASGKDLFLLFTGIGWCKPCMIFDRDVLTKPAFLEQVRTMYTLIELDHTFGDTPAEKARQERFEALEKQYLINAFPTVVLADAAGLPYAVMTGWEGDMPAVLDWISSARAARDERDRAFNAATSAARADRAVQLHKGIQAVAGKLGTTEERGNDPVLVYYKDQIDEIARLDTVGDTHKVYEGRKADRDLWKATQAVYDRLAEFAGANDYRGAVRLIDETLKTTSDRQVRYRFERTRISFLERDKRNEEALQSARRVLGLSDLTAEERYQLMFREAANLVWLGRVDEGIAVFDRCIAAADTTEKHVRRLDWKASMIPLKTHRELKMAAWRACRAEASRGGDEWLKATYFLADDARKAGKPREALALFHEELAFGDSGWTMTQVAECHLDLGDFDKAREWLNKAEAEAAKTKASPRQGERDIAARVEAQVKQLREQLKPG